MSQELDQDLSQKEITQAQDQLKQIEYIIKAENKRRIESNEIMNDYITEFLNSL